MHLRTATLATAALGAMLALSSSAPAKDSGSPRAAQELATALAGRTAGTPLNCIRNSQNIRMHIVDDWTILFRQGSTVYVQKPFGGCHGLANGMSLIRNSVGTTQLCRGDINRIVDLRTGFGTGACVYSEFVPYRKIG